MNDLVLGVVCLALIGYSIYTHRQFSEDRKLFIKAILAKDLRDLDTSEQIEKEDQKESVPVDEIPLESVDDDEFHKQIAIQLKRSQDGQE